ncbi:MULTISPECIES: hypothetical protein [unclassified Streptosporangium]|uniref:hypothetical protein n=1 Tax=unclassified Streptosporangium TaxID=2632669 RepID=UPI002E2810E2|nr:MULTISPECIES: hypothetical protein [unclassified Streptosporangium]
MDTDAFWKLIERSGRETDTGQEHPGARNISAALIQQAVIFRDRHAVREMPAHDGCAALSVVTLETPDRWSSLVGRISP